MSKRRKSYRFVFSGIALFLISSIAFGSTLTSGLEWLGIESAAGFSINREKTDLPQEKLQVVDNTEKSDEEVARTKDPGGFSASYETPKRDVVPELLVPLTGTKNIPGDYGDLAAAIADLNTQGVGAGGVTFNLLAANPQSAPAGGYIIGGTGSAVLASSSAANPIVFTGNANVITASNALTVGAINDAIFKLIGADFVTIQGFTMQENAGNTVNTPAASNTMTEFGVALFYVTTTDGAQNNTIQNNTISLNRTYLNTIGIYSNTRHSATAVTTSAEVTAATGSNSGNKVYGNAVSNVNYGIAFIGAGTTIAAIDNGNDIGGASLATGNTITNWGGGATLSSFVSLTGLNYCIFDNQQINDNVSFNTVTSAALAQGVTTGGILKNFSVAQPVGAFTTTINSNVVQVTNNPTAAAAGGVVGINNSGLTPLNAAVTMSVNNNTVQNSVLGGATSTTNGLTAIANSSLAGTVNLTGNTVLNNSITATTATTGILAGISNTGAAVTVNITNNILRSLSSSAASGQLQGIANSGAVTTAINITGNQLGNAVSGFFSSSVASSGALFGIVNAGGNAAALLTITGNDIRGTTYTSATATAQQLYYNNQTFTGSTNISSNTFTNLSNNTSGSVTMISNSVSHAGGTTHNVNNNSIVTGYNRTGAGGTFAFYNAFGSSASTVTEINNGNNFSNVTFTGATAFIGWRSADGTTPGSRKTVTNNTFDNITGGTSALSSVLYVGFSDNTFANNNVSGNVISNVTAAANISAIFSDGQNQNFFSNRINSINSTGVAANVRAFEISGATTQNVYKNKIYDIQATDAGSTVNGILLSGGTTTNVYNNIIGDLRTPAGNAANPLVGLNVTGGTTVNAYFNTIYLNASSTGATFGSSAVSTATGPTLTLIDNILVNLSTTAGGALAAAYRRSSTTLATYGASSNNNDFFASTLFTDGTNTITTIGAYKTFVAPRDGASFSENPTFISTTGSSSSFLHINTVTATQIESGGSTVAGITDDFDGDTRNVSTPDVGADEFNGVGLDLSAPVITYSALLNTSSTSNRVLSVTITDATGVASGANLPRIYFKKSTDASYVSTQCVMTGGTVMNGTYDCTINNTLVGGGSVTTGDMVQYFVVAQDTAGNLGANPSGGFTGTNVNTVTTPPTSPNQYTIVAPVTGSFSIGTGQTFTSLTNPGGIFEFINNSEVTGNVTLNIVSDLAAETGTVALNQFAGGFNITIKPSGAARSITSTAAATNLIKLNGASNVTIDGSLAGGVDRSLTIENISATAASVVIFGSVGSTPITMDTLKNCVVRNGVNTTSAVLISDAGTPGNAGFFNGITIQNNDVQKAFVGVFASGGTTPQNGANLTYSNNTINTSGANAIRNVGLYMQGVNGATVSGNTVGNFNATNDENDMGIWLATGTINATVSGNTLSALNYTGTAGNSPIAINVTPGVAASNDVITGNIISDMTSSGSSSTNLVMGISVTAVSGGVTINRNNVQNINNNNPATWPAIGININGGNNNILRNNFVARVYNDQTAGTGAFSPTFGVSGIRLNAGTGHQVYNNSVHLYGAMAGTTSTDLLAAMSIASTSVTGADVRNNVLSNQMTGGNTTGGSTRFVGLALPSGGTAAMNLTLNNNAYFEGTDANDRIAVVGTTTGTGDFAAANFVPGATSPATNLRSYTSTLGMATNDNASKATNAAPPFVSNTDLHLANPSNLLIAAGTSIGSVTVDYDGDPRPTNPDMGADEVVQQVGGVFPAGTFYNAEVIGGSTFPGNVDITNTLFIQGATNVGTSTIGIGCNAMIVNGNSGNFIIGNLRKDFCGTGVFIFHVGTVSNGSAFTPEGLPQGEYSPMTATINSGVFPSSLTVNVVDTWLPNLGQTSSISRYWNVTETGDLNADMTFQYLPEDVYGNTALYSVFKWTGGPSTVMYAGGTVDIPNMRFTAPGVTDFSGWAAGVRNVNAANASISGRVTTADGAGIRNAIVRISGGDLPEPLVAQTGSFGLYHFENLRVGQTYVVQVSAKRFRFGAPSQLITLQDDLTGVDFTANPQE